jgi:hypothetical protein
VTLNPKIAPDVLKYKDAFIAWSLDYIRLFKPPQKVAFSYYFNIIISN